MQDASIIQLFWERKEEAIESVIKQYGKYCGVIVRNVLHNEADAEECMNDVWLKLWNAIPPAKPDSLKAYVAKAARNSALSAYRGKTAACRGGDAVTECLDELYECMSLSNNNVDEHFDEMVLKDKLNRFLESQTEINRKIFVRRYFYMDDLKEIARQMRMNVNTVKTVLRRMRSRLALELESEGLQ